ncbi:hypothetical protein L1987_23998 [Smallanthus sonchifolius]|uniref:Uncharacterized protein n=1 Tax=Smallanthus sonchifolius TaxID=185202 RepID=A0ACB9IJ02_9ASTR|nr:hypothetical protein L1987_23998 [Smallanthus sonchifolius]
MKSKGKGIGQESEHDYPRKKHKSRQEGLDEDILNMLNMQSKMSSSQETTLYEIFDFSGFHRNGGGSGGSASSEGIQGSYGAKDKSVLEVVDEGDKGDDDNDDEGDNYQVMVFLKFDARHNVCAYIDDTYASTVGFRDALSWLSRSKDSHAISYTIREVLNNGDERRHKIKANMDYIIECFNRMGCVGNFKKDLVIKTMLSGEWKCITHIIIVCLLNMKGGFDQMNQQWAGAMKCLVMNEPFNYSYLIYNYMLGNIQGDTFLMYPCFIQMIVNAKLKNLPTTGCQLKLTHMGKTIVVDMRESKFEYRRLFDHMYSRARLGLIKLEDNVGGGNE